MHNNCKNTIVLETDSKLKEELFLFLIIVKTKEP